MAAGKFLVRKTLTGALAALTFGGAIAASTLDASAGQRRHVRQHSNNFAGAAAIGSVRDATAAAKHTGGLELSLSASAAASFAAKRWRAERNAWIAAFAVAAWCLLARVYVLARRLADLEDEREARLTAAPATAVRAAAASASASAKNSKGGAGAGAGKGGFEASAAPSAPPLTRANSSGAGKKKQ